MEIPSGPDPRVLAKDFRAASSLSVVIESVDGRNEIFFIGKTSIEALWYMVFFINISIEDKYEANKEATWSPETYQDEARRVY